MFTIFYFYKPSKYTQIGLFGFMLFNPIFLYLANYISSDAIFVSLSLIWFNILLWSIYQPTVKLIIWHALVLFMAFTIRYNALFYPLIAGITFLFYRDQLRLKITGLLICAALILCFIRFNERKYEELTGERQFTPFSGWQIANNAMYAYKFVNRKDVKKTPDKFRVIDKMVRDYFDSTRNNPKHPEENFIASTVYMWSPFTPLRTYMRQLMDKDSAKNDNEFKYWARVAPLYKEYGTYLIKQYPIAFIQYYLLPNAIKYYAPPIEFLENYNTGIDSVDNSARVWFQYKSRRITTIFKDLKVNVLNFFPMLVGTMNVLFFLGLISFIYLKGYQNNKIFSRALFLVVLLWLVNFAFSVFASPIALRFQLFPVLVMISFSILFIDYLIKEAIQDPS